MEDALDHAKEAWINQDSTDVGGDLEVDDNTPDLANISVEKPSGETRNKGKEPLREGGR